MTPRLPRSLIGFQDRLATLLGSDPAAREAIIAGMLHRNPSEATGYWLQLVVSVGIATLGLVLGSTAVVIGAMLIAPLMGPIVSFGMGLAVGSPFLVLRSGGRILMSVVVAIGSSGLLTRLLPFHQLNAELSARTTPTALDLLTAAFCALAGVYASMRPGSDVASTAAGTSIGISLVPPLCASGFGVGTATWPVASGAALLFLTNFVAIVVVGTVAFVAAGFNQVDVQSLEQEELGTVDGARVSRAVARQLARVFASRGGAWLRLVMPFVLLGAVYFPLREALDEVAWQIRVRTAVQDAIARLPSRVVESRVRVERGEVELALVLLGSKSDAEATRARLDTELHRIANVTPRLEVFAVPDAAAFASLESALRPAAPPAVPIRSAPAAQLDEVRRLVQSAVERRWPERTAGSALSVSMTAAATDALHVEVAHLGAMLDEMTRETLERALSEDLERTVTIADVALPAEELAATAGDLAFVARVAPLLDTSRRLASISVCIVQPREPPISPARPKGQPPQELLRSIMLGLLDGHPRASLASGDTWRVRFVAGPCPAVERVEPQAQE
jgi:uncharacterized hydrophobic protein (TIGR00271 family)